MRIEHPKYGIYSYDKNKDRIGAFVHMNGDWYFDSALNIGISDSMKVNLSEMREIALKKLGEKDADKF